MDVRDNTRHMHYPPIMNIDLSQHLRELSVTASTNHERRERVRRDAAPRRQPWWRRAYGVRAAALPRAIALRSSASSSTDSSTPCSRATSRSERPLEEASVTIAEARS